MLFKAKKGNDPDTPGIMEALSGPHRNEFMEAMKNEIAELEHHGTWKVVKRNTVPSDATILPGTWHFGGNAFPVVFCARSKLDSVQEVFYKQMWTFMTPTHLWLAGLQSEC